MLRTMVKTVSRSRSWSGTPGWTEFERGDGAGRMGRARCSWLRDRRFYWSQRSGTDPDAFRFPDDAGSGQTGRMQQVLLGSPSCGCREWLTDVGGWRDRRIALRLTPRRRGFVPFGCGGCGYTLFDLADIYGAGVARRFCSALRQRPGLRSQLVVASKCASGRAGAGNELTLPLRFQWRLHC